MMPDATNYSSNHNAPGELWQQCKEQAAEIERLQNRLRDLAKMLTVASHFCTIRKCMNCDGYYAKGYLCSCGWDSSRSVAKAAGGDDVETT